MARKVNVNGKLIRRPGVYTTIKSGIQNNPIQSDYGMITIIDDGIGAGWGGGKGREAYTFQRIQDFQDFVKGGPLWDLAIPLFKPVPNRPIQGISQVTLIQARDTTAPSILFELTNGDILLTMKDEGLNGNGVESSGVLKRGYAATLEEFQARSAAPTFESSVTQAADTEAVQIKTVVAANIKVGDVFSITMGGETVEYTAISTNALALYTALAALINAEEDMTAVATAEATAEGLVLTGETNDDDFEQTSAVTAVSEKMVLTLWHGSYRGLDPLNNSPYDGTLEANAAPIPIFQSPQCANLTELKEWLDSNPVVQGVCVSEVTIDTGAGDFVSADATNNTGNKLATGGTESYTAGAFTAALSKAKETNCNFFLAMKYGEDADGANNDAILSDVVLEGRYERLLFIAGGATAEELETLTIPIAHHFDSDKVVVVHGDGLNTSRTGFKKRSQLWKAANVLGRIAGLEPQTPGTMKSTGLDAEANPLDEDQQERALDNGVLVTYTDEELGYNVILQAVNSLQENEYLVNDNGTSHSVQVRRICAQLNKDMAIYLKKKFFGKDNEGPNRNTVTEADLEAAMEGFLQTRTASSNQDNLIIRYQNISAVVDQDTYNVSYEFVPNFEVNKFIITGFILER